MLRQTPRHQQARGRLPGSPPPSASAHLARMDRAVQRTAQKAAAAEATVAAAAAAGQDLDISGLMLLRYPLIRGEALRMFDELADQAGGYAACGIASRRQFAVEAVRRTVAKHPEITVGVATLATIEGDIAQILFNWLLAERARLHEDVTVRRQPGVGGGGWWARRPAPCSPTPRHPLRVAQRLP